MSEPDLDLLIGRLAVHSKVLSKREVKDALRRWRAAGKEQEFGPFLVAESQITPPVLDKLLDARDRLVERERAKDEAGGETPAPEREEEAPRGPDDTQPISLLALEQALQDAQSAAESPADDLDETRPVVQEGASTAVAAAPPQAPAAAPAAPPPTPAAPPPTPAAPRRAPPAAQQTLLRFGPEVDLDDLLRQTRELSASDLHVHSGAALKVRLDGRLFDASAVVDRERAEELIRGVLDDSQVAALDRDLQVDFAFEIFGVGRFRANAYRQQRGLDAVFRAIPLAAPTLAELGFPQSFERLASFHQGMVLFTGPAGCGKSSTMAAMVRMINERRPDHVITVEDPIEYVHPSERCVVNQRQVGPHTGSFGRALRAALREDPDVIVIGELRDLETISLALTAAETGHLVLGTLHTSSAIRTVNRLLGVFPPEQQAQIRTMVSESLRAVVSQRLVPRADGRGRVPAVEVLMNTKAVANLIRERKTYQLVSIMQTGSAGGMCLLDASLAALVESGTITREAARQQAEKPETFA